MRIRIAVLFVLFLAALVPSASRAVPCPPLRCGPNTMAAADGRLLAVSVGTGPTTAVYDASTGKRRALIPSGIVSADGKRIVAQAAQQLRTYDLGRMRVVARSSLGAGWLLAGLSADGRRAVVARRPDDSKTQFAVRGAQPGSITLEGRFDFDGLLGNRLYLIEQRQEGYRVRVADLGAGTLDAEALKGADEPTLIRGLPWSRLASPDGRYVFTLYIVAGGSGGAMIHALDMQEGTAKCIGLPGKNDFVTAGTYALALSRDGRTLYAASGANGTIATVDVGSQRVVEVAHLEKEPVRLANGRLLPSAALSPDGKTLAFAVGSTLWIYDLAANELVRKAKVAEGAVAYSRTGVLWLAGIDGLLRRVRPTG
jgi:DNA-binding beta-propeller fold protein YncE